MVCGGRKNCPNFSSSSVLIDSFKTSPYLPFKTFNNRKINETKKNSSSLIPRKWLNKFAGEVIHSLKNSHSIISSEIMILLVSLLLQATTTTKNETNINEIQFHKVNIFIFVCDMIWFVFSRIRTMKSRKFHLLVQFQFCLFLLSVYNLVEIWISYIQKNIYICIL